MLILILGILGETVHLAFTNHEYTNFFVKEQKEDFSPAVLAINSAPDSFGMSFTC